jgi:cell division transport system ATP-binding protein
VTEVEILELEDVTMSYGWGRGRHVVLRDVSFSVAEGGFTILKGPSGAGKSTLLELTLAIRRPDRGSIRIAGRDIARLEKKSIPFVRRNVGVVFQDFKLLPEASPLDNVALALQVLGLRRRHVRARASEVLAQVELDPAIRRPVRCLSGGEQQRVAVARALAGQPAILLADEPTGNLDPRLAMEMLELFDRIRADGTTVVVATHDPLAAEFRAVTQRLELQEGRVVIDTRRGDDRPGLQLAEASAPMGAVA